MKKQNRIITLAFIAICMACLGFEREDCAALAVLIRIVFDIPPSEPPAKPKKRVTKKGK